MREYWLFQDRGLTRLYDVTNWEDKEKRAIRECDGQVTTFSKWPLWVTVWTDALGLLNDHRSNTPRPYLWEFRAGSGPMPALTLQLEEGVMYTLTVASYT